MSKRWFAALFVAIFSVIIAYLMYGPYAFIFLPIFLLLFLVMFGALAFGNSLQADSIPGLQELPEPDFFFSRVYMAWLYVNDRERWAEYTVLFSYSLGSAFGSLFGIVASVSLQLDFKVSLTGWLLGMFIFSLIAIRKAASERWMKTEEYDSSRRVDQQAE